KASSNRSSIAVDILRGLVGLLIFGAALSWFITGESFIWDYRKAPTVYGAVKRWFGGPLELTDSQLALYNGTDPSLPIYVGLNGSVYDVTASPQTYGPGGSYSFFSGRDATRSFITGCFKEDLTPDMRGLEEMYTPLDDPEEAALSKAQSKIRREADRRRARKRITEGIANWESVFKGETGRPYFYVGSIKREKGWLEKLPRRELCQAAKEARQTRK
ncbi:cytochrome b5, partial [Tothia fuscella]